jgi:hypothetical protein
VDAIEALAWQLVSTYNEHKLLDEWMNVHPLNRRKIIQMINASLQQKKTKMLLTADHIRLISSILLHEDDEKILAFHFDLSMYILFLLLKQMQKRIQNLDDKENQETEL